MSALALMAEVAARENAAMRRVCFEASPSRNWQQPSGDARAKRCLVADNAAKISAAVNAKPGRTREQLMAATGLSLHQWKKAYGFLRKSGAVVMRRDVVGAGEVANYWPGDVQ
jgi:hypothetical protein